MKQVYTTTTIADAEIIRMILRKYGILSMLEGAGVGIRGPATPLVISVQDADAKNAFEIIREARSPGKAAPKKRKRKTSGRTAKKKKSPPKKSRKPASRKKKHR